MSGILVVAEHTRGALSDLTGELIGASTQIKDKIGGPVRVLVVGEQPDTFVEALRFEGVDEILLARTENPHFDAAASEAAVLAAAKQCEPSLILVGHSANGLSFGAGLAVCLGSGFAADVFGIDIAEHGLRVTRSGYGNKVNVEIDFPQKPIVVLTVRGATFKPPLSGGEAVVTPLQLDLESVTGRYAHEDFIEAPSSGVDIGKADFIMSIGRGIQDEKNVPRFADLADRIGATLGCSRPIADSGWLHKAHQVGLTGKVAGNCKLYLALGISGAVQHLHGMKHVETIIAVNTDPNAPIYNVATYGCVMDVFAFADALEKAIEGTSA
ncbi:electron transfer flavoprotein subunit alpha/FixB family protein [Thauera sp. WH-2]|uniref:electron transfer flavoprotein subunit alpha/FixB family protein n=1 Tax=Thauera sp. WH-2 TaxID=3401574 RepID=UPI003AACA64B